MSEENKNSEFSFENESYRKTYWHTCSHILAQAVKRLYPEVKLAIGPSIDEGWYYDMDAPFAFTPEHHGPKIEAEMRKICKEKLKLERFELPREEAIKFMEEKGEPYKVELIQDLPEDAPHLLLQAGRVHRPVRRPPSGLHRPGQGQRHQADSPATPPTGGATPTGRPCSASTASPSPRRTSWTPISSALRRPSSRDHRKLGKELGLFTIPGRGPRLPLLPAQGHGAEEHPHRLLAAGRTRRCELCGDLHSPDHAQAVPVGDLRPLGPLQGQHVHHRHRRARTSPSSP